ncbi:uncharacterized protein LOC110265389 [Arachis ipaensis]|uniref:uncharacterized protein LOC110265389 n=1 Tax=Arachis ipaensis TaxID=130454 RepID=UPI000A2B073B|nr:uncharacterized protein LOC110265389 [Arachis ipaensis]
MAAVASRCTAAPPCFLHREISFALCSKDGDTTGWRLGLLATATPHAMKTATVARRLCLLLAWSSSALAQTATRRDGDPERHGGSLTTLSFSLRSPPSSVSSGDDGGSDTDRAASLFSPPPCFLVLPFLYFRFPLFFSFLPPLRLTAREGGTTVAPLSLSSSRVESPLPTSPAAALLCRRHEDLADVFPFADCRRLWSKERKGSHGGGNREAPLCSAKPLLPLRTPSPLLLGLSRRDRASAARNLPPLPLETAFEACVCWKLVSFYE